MNSPVAKNEACGNLREVPVSYNHKERTFFIYSCSFLSVIVECRILKSLKISAPLPRRLVEKDTFDNLVLGIDKTVGPGILDSTILIEFFPSEEETWALIAVSNFAIFLASFSCVLLYAPVGLLTLRSQRLPSKSNREQSVIRKDAFFNGPMPRAGLTRQIFLSKARIISCRKANPKLPKRN
jgi:hypothetical protein